MIPLQSGWISLWMVVYPLKMDVPDLELPSLPGILKTIHRDNIERFYIVEWAMVIEQRLKEESESKSNYIR
jgi:hypothetical protein